jgi:toxin ParE1/3/4
VPVLWRRLALRDLGRIVSYMSVENPVAAVRVARELTLPADSQVIFPYRGRPGREPRTRDLLAVYLYHIVYRVLAGQPVVILRIWHGARERA